jgi:hypothetical protein
MADDSHCREWCEDLRAAHDVDWRSTALLLATAADELLAFLDRPRRGALAEDVVERVRRTTVENLSAASRLAWDCEGADR